MRISSKGRLALIALCEMALSDDNKLITLSALSQKLNCSKLYLEQVFAVLRRSELVLANKGAGGGYFLARKAEEISMYDILAPLELSLFAPSEHTGDASVAHIENSLHELVFTPLDQSLAHLLSSISLANLAEKTREQQSDMYYI